MSNRIVAPARQARIRFLGSLKGLQIRALVGPKRCRVVAEGRRSKDDRKQNTLAPLIHTCQAYSMYDVQHLCLYTQVFFILMLYKLPHPVHFLQQIFGRVNRMFYFNVPLYFDTFNPPVGASLMHTVHPSDFFFNLSNNFKLYRPEDLYFPLLI